jgi:hypothetical protein
MGAFINFATDATGFAEKFPTCDMRMLTLKGNLLVPFHREWALALGVGVASERCINHCLSSGKSVGLVGTRGRNECVHCCACVTVVHGRVQSVALRRACVPSLASSSWC